MSCTSRTVVASWTHLTGWPVCCVAVVTRWAHGAGNGYIITDSSVRFSFVSKWTAEGHVAALRAVLGEHAEDRSVSGVGAVVACPADGWVACGAVTVVTWATVNLQWCSCGAFVGLPAWDALKPHREDDRNGWDQWWLWTLQAWNDSVGSIRSNVQCWPFCCVSKQARVLDGQTYRCTDPWAVTWPSLMMSASPTWTVQRQSTHTKN